MPFEMDSTISIHAPPPRGGRLDASDVDLIIFDISIHAPRKGGDGPWTLVNHLKLQQFQSTPPARGATAKMHSFTCGSLTNK